MARRHDLSVLHIGAGKYKPLDRANVTYGIWRELAKGFRAYHVIGRSTGRGAEWSDGNLHIVLIPSRASREAEFLVTQFRAVPLMLRSAPDVILCQSPALGGLAALVVGRLKGARILVELHGMEFFAPAHFGSKLWLLQRFSRFALNRADRIRVLSQRMRISLARTYGAHLLARTVVLPPRVDTAEFQSRKGKRANNEPLRVAMLGAVNDNKGQLRLICALESSPIAVELHIVGDGPAMDKCRDRAAALADRSPLRVHFHGRVPHSDVAERLQSCDLLVMYSRMEATPRAIMEAMASGLPVVTTDAGFCADIVQDGVEGFVLGDDPDKEILGVLSRFNEDRMLLSRMGAAARERACRDYDSVRLFGEYRRLIAETAQA